jgi:hypothetical protein
VIGFASVLESVRLFVRFVQEKRAEAGTASKGDEWKEVVSVEYFESEIHFVQIRALHPLACYK